MEVREVELSQVHVGKYQLREKIPQKALERMSTSLEATDLLQPLIVQEREEGGYDLVAGHLRLEALKAAGRKSANAVLLGKGDLDGLRAALTENLIREDLKPLEKARGIKKLVELGMSQSEVGKVLGLSPPQISNLLALFELEPEVRQALDSGEINFGHAKAILALRGNREAQLKALAQIKALKEAGERATARLVESLVRRIRAEVAGKKKESWELKLPKGVLLEERARSKRLIFLFRGLEELRGRLQELLRENPGLG